MAGGSFHRLDAKSACRDSRTRRKINDPALVEKDYRITHVIFGLKQLGLRFEFKGGTSLPKGFGCDSSVFRRYRHSYRVLESA
jgi:hypothetical protein